MPHLWIDKSDTWTILTLDREGYRLDVRPPVALSDSDAADCPRAALLRAGLPDSRTWVVLSGALGDVQVNGLPVRAGIRVLADRDEIRVARQPAMFFSTEVLAEVTPCPEEASSLFCPRCKQRIEARSPAVRCPHCDVWHHQSPELPCWTYAETCAICAARTALDAGFTWTPEER